VFSLGSQLPLSKVMLSSLALLVIRLQADSGWGIRAPLTFCFHKETASIQHTENRFPDQHAEGFLFSKRTA
jgi:hypothetical protein